MDYLPQILHVFIKENDQITVLKLIVSRYLLSIAKPFIESTKNNTSEEDIEKYVKNRSVINIKQLMLKREKRIYRSLFENSGKWDFYELFRGTSRELLTAKSVLQRVVYENFGNWEISNIKRFFNEYIESPYDYILNEIGELFENNNTNYVFRSFSLEIAVKNKRLVNVQYFIEKFGDKIQWVELSHIWSLKYESFIITDYLQSEYMDILKNIYLDTYLPVFFLDFTLKRITGEHLIEILKRIEIIIEEQEKENRIDSIKYYYNNGLTCACKLNIGELVDYFLRKASGCYRCECKVEDHVNNARAWGLRGLGI